MNVLFLRGIIRPAIIATVLAASTVMFLGVVSAYKPPAYWHDYFAQNTIHVEGESQISVSSNFGGIGYSTTLQGYSTTSTRNTGKAKCDYTIYNRWSTYSGLIGVQSSAAGAGARCGSADVECYQSYTEHYFTVSGVFTASPHTAAGADFAEYYCQP